MRAGQFLPFIFFLIFISCDSTEPEPPKDEPEPIVKSITLSADKFTCTEVWLSVSSENLVLPRNAGIYRGDSLIEQISLNKPDTLLYYVGLLPAKDYTFRMTIPEDTVESNTVAFRTLDTTSHNFTYQTWEFGDFNSSVLYDVAIINENNIWAVGEIYTTEDKYNAVHWNGSKWELKKLLYNEGFWVIKTLHAFNENDIWFEGFLRWNGTEFITLSIPAALTGWDKLAMWGRSSSDLYIVGNYGNIAHYNGVQWQKIESPIGASGTNLPLTGVFGNALGEVYASGSLTATIEGILLRGTSANNWSIFIESGSVSPSQLFNKLYGELASVWIDEVGTIYTGGNLLFRYKNRKWNYVTSLPENYLGGNIGTFYRGFINSIKGNGSNDYIIAGDRNTLKHFNGKSWQQIGMPYNPSSPIIWFSVDQKNSIAVAVGLNGNKAFVMMLKR